MDSICYIYSISDPVTGLPFYIGKTINIDVRKYTHLNKSHNLEVRSKIDDIVSNGKFPIFTVLEKCLLVESKECERSWINKMIQTGVDIFNSQNRSRIRHKKNDSLLFEVKQIPVYILQSKYDAVKRLASNKRESMTKWIESAIDAKIKKEDK